MRTLGVCVDNVSQSPDFAFLNFYETIMQRIPETLIFQELVLVINPYLALE